jgi:hypothetical protein
MSLPEIKHRFPGRPVSSLLTVLKSYHMLCSPFKVKPTFRGNIMSPSSGSIDLSPAFTLVILLALFDPEDGGSFSETSADFQRSTLFITAVVRTRKSYIHCTDCESLLLIVKVMG